MRGFAAIGVLCAIGCGGGEHGALFVFHGAIATADHVEIVLASPDTAERFEADQRVNAGTTSIEPVTYYRQRQTSGSIALEGVTIDGFAVRLEPNPKPEPFIPFAMVYDAQGALVAVGRIGDGAPATIEIPAKKLERYDVDLEAIAEPGAEGITAGHGLALSCGRDMPPIMTGAAWRFSTGGQLRLAFATDYNPYDLDCDDHDVEFQADCDDLDGRFHPGALEECTTGTDAPLDVNCDGRYNGFSACVIPDPANPMPLEQCKGLSGCGDTTCIPDMDPANLDGPCRCILNECNRDYGCFVYHYGDVGTAETCLPGATKFHDLCPPGMDCMVDVKGEPDQWSIEIGSYNGGGGIVFSKTAMITASSPDLYMRATPMDIRQVAMMYGEIDLQVKTSGAKQRFLMTVVLGEQVQSRDGCPPFTVPGANATNLLECALIR